MKTPTQRPQNQSRQDESARWQRYEALKAQYIDAAENQQQYEAACRRAAREAGV